MTLLEKKQLVKEMLVVKLSGFKIKDLRSMAKTENIKLSSNKRDTIVDIIATITVDREYGEISA